MFFLVEPRIKPSKPKDYKALIIMVLVVTGSTRGIWKTVHRFAHSASPSSFLLEIPISLDTQAKDLTTSSPSLTVRWHAADLSLHESVENFTAFYTSTTY